MRAFWIALALISIPVIMLLSLPVAQQFATPSTLYHDWFAPFGLAFLATVLILFAFRRAHRRDGKRSH